VEKILGFRGDFSFLSNFHESIVRFEGESYKTVEHAYQTQKTLDPWSRRLVREASSPGEAKQLGKSVKARSDWEKVKVDIMRQLVKKKFENPFMTPLLLATGDAEIVEVNTWGDDFWGVCRGEGQNILGKILMDVRKELREEAEK
jgi:ribA/ribD-fused uncharacterized protein